MIKLDLHVHTIYSFDSTNKIKTIYKICKQNNIVPAIADHNSIKAHKELEKLGLEFIKAEEIKTDKGDLIGLNLTEEIPKGTEFFEALDRIKEQGAISYAPHPYDKIRKGIGDLAKHAQIIEVFNARAFSWQNKKALEKADEWNKIKGAGSDAHYSIEIGNAYVLTKPFDTKNTKEILKAIKKGTIEGKRTNTCIARCTAGFVKIGKILGMIENPK